jgi:hypothetical protein
LRGGLTERRVLFSGSGMDTGTDTFSRVEVLKLFNFIYRYERAPVVEPKDFWADMPIKRSSTFRHLALEHSGAGSCVNECVVARAHDRALPLKIRMFMKENVNRKGFATSAGSENKEPAAGWDVPKTVLDIQAAIANLADVFAALWPLDPTPRIISRILITYDYGAAYMSAEKERCRVLEEFCDAILRENARRAVTIGYPLSYQQARERWRDITELKRVGQAKQSSGPVAGQGKQEPSKGQQSNRGGHQGQGRFGPPGGGSSAARSTTGRGATIKFNGDLVCFHFNNRAGCSRPVKGAGCDNGRGGTYAHVCNYEFGNGVNCLAKHARHNNH